MEIPITTTLFDNQLIDSKGKLTTTRPDAWFKKHPEILTQLINQTNFLNENSSVQERIYCLINKIEQIPTCKNCGNPVKFKKNLFCYATFCSRKCATKHETTKQKRIKTNFKKYGKANVSEIDIVKEKKKQTLLKNYGAINLNKIEIINEKRKNTNLLKYGHYNPFGSKIIKQKIKEKNKKIYGVEYIGSCYIGKQALEKLNDKQWLIQQHHYNKLTLKQISEQINVDPTTVANFCRKHQIEIKYFFVSQGEKQIIDFIKQINKNIKILTNVRNIISPYELDIYIPEHNLAIEYCGLYWHSDRFKPKNYHEDKHRRCLEQQINLLTIFEDDWLHKQHIIKNIIKQRLNLNDMPRIYARNCQVKHITDNKQKRDFFEKNHIQGNAKSSLCYGLFHNEQLVACLSLISMKNHQYEINRYATNAKVIGGFSKLLSYFKQQNPDWKSIYTFADKTWSNGDLYKVSGFEFTKQIPASYYYVVGTRRVHRSNFMRKHLTKRIKNFDPNLTEFENCDRNGILRVWNCGLLKFELKNMLKK